MAMGSIVIGSSEPYGTGLVRSTSFGRKRVALSNIITSEFGDNDCIHSAPKKQCVEDSFLRAEKSGIEALPQDILIRILCGVEHDDLKRLFFVSKSIREATIVAKQMHFAYSTPKKTVGFKNFEDLDAFDDAEAPNAPKQSRVPRSRLCLKKLADISVALFASDNEEGWSRKNLFGEIETDFE